MRTPCQQPLPPPPRPSTSPKQPTRGRLSPRRQGHPEYRRFARRSLTQRLHSWSRRLNSWSRRVYSWSRKECVPALARVAFLWNPDNDSNLIFLEELITAVPALGLQLISVLIRNADQFEGAFAAMMRRMPNAAVTTGDPLLRRHTSRIVDFAAKNRLPSMYQTKEYVTAGGLMSYGVNLPNMFRRAAFYVHRILQGEKPADLPIEQPTHFELAINLKTAKALGLSIPETLLATADER